ncbi:hypothetical protein GCM10023331_11860 [Algivirga pacifica]|uniref:Periplasmic heavy metal sensor n=2 Tax=Algivirga pacifica TaxID=1162670 RepID=A0ABP9D6N3_9BACT
MIVGVNFSVQAQRGNGPSPQERLDEMITKMDARLDLDDVQEEEIRSLHKGFYQEMRAARQSGTMDREAMRAKRQENEKKILAVLTEEQQELYEQYKDEWQPARKGRRR